MTDVGRLTDGALRLRHPGPGPHSWLAEFRAARLADWDGQPEPSARSVSLAGLLAGDAAVLRSQHERLVGEGVPAQAAATYLAGWFGGGLAEVVGIGLAGAGAGFCIDPDAVQFDLHADGWPLRVLPGGPLVVAARHPWAGEPDVVVVDRPDDVLERAVGSLIESAAPIVQACRALTPVGTAGLWNEVGDSLACVLAYQRLLPADEEVHALLETAAAWPGVPWKARARLGVARSEALGQVAVAQKGGCCLAYTRDRTGDDLDDGEQVDPGPEHAAWAERFPVDPDAPSYCSTCTFRDPDDCDARQVFWLERLAARAR